MKNINIYNVFNEYEVSTVDDKIYWVSAEEWSPYEAGYTDLVDPEDIFTDYHHGEGVIVSGGDNFDDILLLNRPNQLHGDEEDSNNFITELKALPVWTASKYLVASLSRFPSIRYCDTGKMVSLDEAVVIMAKLGYIWNPDREQFEKKDPEKEPAA